MLHSLPFEIAFLIAAVSVAIACAIYEIVRRVKGGKKSGSDGQKYGNS